MEIQASELRIGNKVFLNDEIDTICEIGQANNGFCENGGYFNFDKGGIRPIEISEEILLKNCGFKVADKSDSFGGYLSPELPNGNKIRLQKRDGKFVWNTQHAIVELEFIHELQNFFKIFKTELVINL
jgi:hypothetical protein